MSATQAQQRFALDLLRKVGVYESNTVDRQIARAYGLPQGDTVREAVGSLSRLECSALIDRLKGTD